MYRHELLSAAERAALQSAERAGNLPDVLETLSVTILRRLEFRLHLWSNVVNTAGLIVVTLTIMMTVYWVFVPIVELISGNANPLHHPQPYIWRR
jgi:type II secretory pathway component PulF